MSLTPRQIQIGRLLAKGLTTAEIAPRLNLSERVIRFHADRLAVQFGTLSRYQLGYRFAKWEVEHLSKVTVCADASDDLEIEQNL